MIKQIFAIMVVAASATASAQVSIHRNTLGSGEQGVKGFENATLVLDNNIYHAPQYMPMYPTAATIWPRVVDVECTKTNHGLKCEGYDWLPALGRGEYLFFKPVMKQPSPASIEIRERVIIKEVAIKKIRQ